MAAAAANTRPSVHLFSLANRKKPLIKRPFNDDDDTAALWQSLPGKMLHRLLFGENKKGKESGLLHLEKPT
jgi:hypothetical protein